VPGAFRPRAMAAAAITFASTKAAVFSVTMRCASVCASAPPAASRAIRAATTHCASKRSRVACWATPSQGFSMVLCARPTISARLGAPCGIGALALAFLLLRLMVPHRTAHGSARRAVMAGVMTDRAADECALEATFRITGVGQCQDRQTHGSTEQKRFHGPVLR